MVAIRNNHLTGRQIGSPMTALALKILKQKEYVRKDFISNYDGYGKANKIFLSSTYFIKDNNNELIGMLCVNNDMTDIDIFKNSFETFLKRFNYRDEIIDDSQYEEFIENPMLSVANSLISDSINKLSIPTNRMSSEEKMDIIQDLNSNGVFLLKGAISDVARQLDISENTVYRYLK